MSFPTLSDRDLAVLHDVYRLRYASTTQLLSTQFGALRSKTPGYRALKRLTELGFLRAFTVANVPERLFALTASGADVYADSRGAARSDLKLWRPNRQVPVSPFFMRHFLGVGDVRLSIERDVAQTPGIELPVWLPEYAAGKVERRRPVPILRQTVGSGTRALGHTPDAGFCLSSDRRSRIFLLEYDRGTEGLSNPEKGFLRFVRFYLRGLVAQNPFRSLSAGLPPTGEPFVVVVVFESEARQRAALRALSQTISDSGLPLLAGFFSAVAPLEQPLSMGWRSLRPRDTREYQIVDPLRPEV